MCDNPHTKLTPQGPYEARHLADLGVSSLPRDLKPGGFRIRRIVSQTIHTTLPCLFGHTLQPGPTLENFPDPSLSKKKTFTQSERV